MIGAGGDSGAGFGCNAEISADQEMGSVFESFKARCPGLFEDCVGDGDGFLTLPESLAIGGGISEEESMLRDLEGYGYNPNHFLTLENLDVPLRYDKATVLESEKWAWENLPEAQAVREALIPWRNCVAERRIHIAAIVGFVPGNDVKLHQTPICTLLVSVLDEFGISWKF